MRTAVAFAGQCERMGQNHTRCDIYDPPDYPDSSTFYESLGGWALALYVVCSIVFGILIGEYILLAQYIISRIPRGRRILTLWVTSIHLISAMMALISILAPMASDFVWTFYKGYVGVILAAFLAMTIEMLGGETKMIRSVEENGHNFNMRVSPCCWMCCLPSNTPLTRKKLQLLKGCVYQVPFVYTWVIFIMVVLNQCELLEIGNTDSNDAYLYLNSTLMLSFFVGLWALFTIFGVEKKYQLLGANNYRTKAMLLKVTIVLMNVQDFIIDFFITREVIDCLSEDISGKTFGTIIKNVLVTSEALVLGSIVLWIYIKDD